MILRRTNSGPAEPHREAAVSSDIQDGGMLLADSESANVEGQMIIGRTFDAIAAADRIVSLLDLNNQFRQAIQGLGFTLFAGIDLAELGGKLTIRFLFGEAFEPWGSHYLSMGCAKEDAIFRECFSTPNPFYWGEVVDRGALTPDALKIVNDARGFGLHEGFVLPTHKPDGSNFAVCFAGERVNRRSPLARAASHLLASYYGMIGQRLYSAPHPALNESLTKRQRECLTWVHAGKTSTEIAEILGISHEVVDEHVALACKRLGVRTRAQAVAIAAVRGYLRS